MTRSYSLLDRKPSSDQSASSSVLGRSILIGILTISFVLACLCVVFVTFTYVQHLQANSCRCPTTQLYHISGFDPEIKWRPKLAIFDSNAFKSASADCSKRLRAKLMHDLDVADVEITKFSQGQTTHGVVSGSIFYGIVTLKEPNLPTPLELKVLYDSTLSGDDDVMDGNRFRIFDVNTIISPIINGPDPSTKHKVFKREAGIQAAESEQINENGFDFQSFSAGGCQPGFTGQFCQIALCTTRGNITSPSDQFSLISAQYNAICAGTASFPVDSHLPIIYATLYSPAQPAYGQMSLIDPNGNLVPQNQLTVIANKTGILQYALNNPIPGQWAIQFSSATPCVVFSSGLATMTLNVGFVSGPNAIHLDAPSNTIVTGQKSYFVAHGDGLACPGKVQFLEIYENGQLIFSAPAQTRYHCAYEFYFGLITCNAVNQYFYKVFGIDENGYSFGRTSIINCTTNGTSTTPGPVTTSQPLTTSPITPIQCQNGGTPLGTFCICPAYFTGKKCQTSICINGGTPSPTNGCNCLPGYNGTHCQNIVCQPHPARSFNTVHRTLSIIIGTRISMSNDLFSVQRSANQLVTKWNQDHPGEITNYIFGTYYNSKIDIQTFTDPFDFLNYLNGVTAGNPMGSCDQEILTLLYGTLAYQIQPKSPIFIFSDSDASDYAQAPSLLQYNARHTQAQLYFINSAPSGFNCDINAKAPGYQVFNTLSQASGGLVIRVDKAQVGNVFSSIFSGDYGTDSLFLADYQNCASQPAYTPIFVDSTVNNLVIKARAGIHLLGDTPNIVVTNPSGNPTQPITTIQYGNFKLFSFNNLSPGSYLVNVTATTSADDQSCSVRVRGQTQMQMFHGFANNFNTDLSTQQPFDGTPISLVAHLQFYSQWMVGQSSQAVIAQGAPANVNYFSNGRYRLFNCQYMLLFDQYQCHASNPLFYVTIYGTDQYGYPFQRSAPGYCQKAQPLTTTTTIQPTTSPTCSNGGVLVNGTCICPAAWTGPLCGVPICFNGGTPNRGKCTCAPGFTGTHCSSDMCSALNPNVPNSPNQRSLALVVENSISNIAALIQLRSDISNLLGQIYLQNTAWISSYVLITFTDTAVSPVFVTGNATQFIKAVSSINAIAKFNCPTMSGTALSTALKHSSQYGLVYLFAASSMAVSDASVIPAIFSLLENNKASISVFMESTNPCGTNFTGESVNILYYVTAFSDGQFLILEPLQNVIQGAITYIPTKYSSSLVGYVTQTSCYGNNSTTLYFPVDSHTTAFTVTAQGYMNKLMLYSPNGQPVTDTSAGVLQIISGSNFTTIVQVLEKAPGIWTAILSVAKPGVSCSLQARVQSDLQLYAGFVRNIHNDFPSNEPLNITGHQDRMVAHVTNLPPAGTLENVLLVSSNNSLQGNSFFSKRAGCNYEWLSDSFTCPSSAFGLVASGYDEMGYLYSRISTAVCIPPSNACQNGGLFVNNGCLCQALWTGPFCGQAVCLNGGTNQGPICHCVAGISGPHCSYATCPQAVPANFGPGQRSLVFVVDTTISNALGISFLKQSAPSFLNQIKNQHPNWFTNFVLVPFGDPAPGQNPVGTVSSSTTTAGFLTILNQNLQFTQDPNYDCPNPTLHGLQAVFNNTGSMLQQNSLIYLFTKATAKDTQLVGPLLYQAALKSSQINIVLESLNPCQSQFTTPGSLVYTSITAATGGSLIIASPSKLTPNVLNYITTQYSSTLIGVLGSSQCSNAVDYLPVDSHIYSFTFTFSGYMPQVTWKNSSGAVIPYSTVLNSMGELIGTVNAPSPGIWTATFSTQNGGGCQINIYAMTDLVPYYGFSLNQVSDSPQPYAYPGSTTRIYMLTHITNLPTSATLEYVEIYVRNATLTGSAQFMPRKSCSYDYISQPFSCPAAFFGVAIYGYDENGYLYQRTGISQCPLIACLNGGVNANGQCLCPSVWTGANCGTPICLNGGTNVGSTCKCTSGYSGIHCKQDQCTSQNPNVMNSPNNRTLAFVIQNTITMSLDLQQILEEINFVLAQISRQNANWYNWYTLVTFTDTVAVQVASTSNPQFFALAIQSIKTTNFPKLCPKLLGAALVTALKSLKSQYSSVYVFTDSTMGDFNTQVGNVFGLLETTKATVNIIVSVPNPCGTNFNTPQSKILYQITKFSDGELLTVTKPDIASVMSYVPMNYQSGLVSTMSFMDCTTQQTFYFPVDSHTSSFAIVAHGYQSNVQVFDTTGKLHIATPVVSSSMGLKIYQVYTRGGVHNTTSPILAGIWHVTVSTTLIQGISPGCSVDIRAQSNLQIYYGFALTQHNDYPFSQPKNISGAPNRMVAHVTNLNSIGTLEFMLMYSISGQQIGAAKFGKRYGCGYEYISQQFSCHATGFGIVTGGYDENGYLYNRIRTAICVNPSQPCKNGGVFAQGQCICPTFWRGAICTQTVCINGGTNTGNKCNCPPNFTGTNCQYNLCQKPFPISFSPNNRSLVLVIDVSATNAVYLEQLKTSVPLFLQSVLARLPNWLENVILIPFFNPINSTQSPIRTVTNSQSVKVLTAALQALQPIAGAGTCHTPSLHGLQSALKQINGNSIVYLFTVGFPSDLQLARPVLDSIGVTGAQVNVALGNLNPCNETFSSNSAQVLYDMTVISGGSFFVGTPLTMNNLVKSYISSGYSSGMSAYRTFEDCSTAPQTVYVPVDSFAGSVTFLMDGASPNATWMSASGVIVPTETLSLSNNLQTVATLKKPAPGVWQVSLSTQSGGCLLQVATQSRLEIYFGFTRMPSDDVPLPMAFKNADNLIMAHVNNLLGGTLESANIYTLTTLQQVGSVRFFLRQGCSYDYISEPFQCPDLYFTVIFSGYDHNGWLYRRINVVQCGL